MPTSWPTVSLYTALPWLQYTISVSCLSAPVMRVHQTAADGSSLSLEVANTKICTVRTIAVGDWQTVHHDMSHFLCPACVASHAAGLRSSPCLTSDAYRLRLTQPDHGVTPSLQLPPDRLTHKPHQVSRVKSGRDA